MFAPAVMPGRCDAMMLCHLILPASVSFHLSSTSSMLMASRIELGEFQHVVGTITFPGLRHHAGFRNQYGIHLVARFEDMLHIDETFIPTHESSANLVFLKR